MIIYNKGYRKKWLLGIKLWMGRKKKILKLNKNLGKKKVLLIDKKGMMILFQIRKVKILINFYFKKTKNFRKKISLVQLNYRSLCINKQKNLFLIKRMGVFWKFRKF